MARERSPRTVAFLPDIELDYFYGRESISESLSGARRHLAKAIPGALRWTNPWTMKGGFAFFLAAGLALTSAGGSGDGSGSDDTWFDMESSYGGPGSSSSSSGPGGWGGSSGGSYGPVHDETAKAPPSNAELINKLKELVRTVPTDASTRQQIDSKIAELEAAFAGCGNAPAAPSGPMEELTCGSAAQQVKFLPFEKAFGPSSSLAAEIAAAKAQGTRVCLCR